MYVGDTHLRILFTLGSKEVIFDSYAFVTLLCKLFPLIVYKRKAVEGIVRMHLRLWLRLMTISSGTARR